MILARLTVRRHRVLILSWSALLIALAGGTAWSYQSTYPTPEQRRTAAELARDNAASTLLYGDLPAPGTPAQMFTWEVGAFVTILAAVMAVLVGVAATRAAEDDGTLELVRASGVGRRTPLYSALAVLTAVAATLTVACAVAVGLGAGRVDGWPGAAVFGAVVGVTFLLVAALTFGLAQIVPTAGAARILGFAAVGAAFVLRATADSRDVGWLNWLSPLGLRATVRPFSGDRWWVVGAYVVVAAAAAWLALILHDRREYRAGLVGRRDVRAARMRVRSSFGLAVRLAREPVLAWTVAVSGIAVLFSTMGSGVVEQERDGDVGGFLGSQLGTGDPVAGYFAYTATVVGIVSSAFAVLSVLRARHDEAAGLTDHVLATGVRRWAPLAAQVAVTAAGTAAVLVTAGAASALVAPSVIDGDHVAGRAFGYIVGQWPTALAMAGLTALLAGCWPRSTGLAWVPLAASAVVALLGELLGLPRWAFDVSLLQHVPDVAADDPDARGLLTLLALGGAATLLGVAGVTRREVMAGR